MSGESTRRVAAIDCGTNSLRLLIADVDPAAQRLVDVQRRMEIVRLGQGVDATGRFDPAALQRALSLTAEYASSCREAGVGAIRFVATSASRDAEDAQDFIDGVRDLLGVEPEVISGDEEAALSFLGATRGLQAIPVPDGERLPVLVVDIGGGSTEVVLGELGGGATGQNPAQDTAQDTARITASRSVDIGCVRLFERHGGDLAAIRADLEAGLDDVARVVPLHRARALVGLAGSITTLTAHALRLPRYQPERIHGAVLPIATVAAACDDMAALTGDQRRALPYLHPGRVDVIVAGALIWRGVLDRVAAASGVQQVVTSEHDILDGIAWSVAETG
ncbi:MAG: exopolyphosphatase [Kineosporiaceae bacterium]